jgi:2-aminoethylphosphonate-pyruvate transaminase
MSATLIHHGHIRLINNVKSSYPDCYLIIALTSDEEIQEHKGYDAELSFEHRKEIIGSIKGVDEVIVSPWRIDSKFIEDNSIDLLAHGSDNSNPVDNIFILPRTEGVSSTELRERAFFSIISKRNKRKEMFTPGPAQLSAEGILNLRPVFGRGDAEYDRIEKTVLDGLMKLTSKNSIVRLQGGSTNGIEIAMMNFLQGRVLFIDSGYYSNRSLNMAKNNFVLSNLDIISCSPDEIHNYDDDTIDWIFLAHSETGNGWKFSDDYLDQLKQNFPKTRFMFDSTASINLEYENISDVQCFSSCKGLGGITGAAFIAYNVDKVDGRNLPFTFDISTYENKLFTGPYHAICSLEYSVKNLDKIRVNVKKQKEIFIKANKENIIFSAENQPLISTKVSKKIVGSSDEIHYIPRTVKEGESIVCHFNKMFT